MDTLGTDTKNLLCGGDVTIVARCGTQCRADDFVNQSSMIPVGIEWVNERIVRVAKYLRKLDALLAEKL